MVKWPRGIREMNREQYRGAQVKWWLLRVLYHSLPTRKTQCQGNHWINSFGTSIIIYSGWMLWRLLNDLVGQPVRRTLRRRYCNEYYVMSRHQGWVRLKRLPSKALKQGDWSTIDDWCSRLDINFLMSYAFISHCGLSNTAQDWKLLIPVIRKELTAL